MPSPLTAFLGREREVAEVQRLLSTTRLLTLTGAGGIGKTRLALRVAGEALDAYPDGVWLVELSPLADPALVAPAVAAALGVREEAGRELVDTLLAFLASRSTLLVLDNCEHLAHGCARLAERVLRACSAVQILATSRQPLELIGETTWRVPSMTLPELVRRPGAPGALAAPDLLASLARSEAARLFIERAQAAVPAFAVTTRNAAAVADVCWRLDGIPLALELAAARTRALSVEQMAARLHDRLQLLTSGGPTAQPRQRTLRGTIDWSYDLLTEQERVLLRRLAVFAGGWTLEASEAVCADGPDTGAPDGSAGCLLSPGDVLDVLAHLVDKSLVLVEEHDDAARYRLLEAIRQYALERLRDAGEQASVQAAHAAYYLGVAEHAEDAVLGGDQHTWLRRLDAEHDNLRAALSWSQATDDAELGLRLAGALAQFWTRRGHFGEGRGWLTSVLAASSPVPGSSRAKALAGAGHLAFSQGEYAEAAQLFEQSLGIARALDDTLASAVALGELGMVASYSGAHDRAAALFEEALGLFRAAGHRWRTSWTLRILGRTVLGQGDTARAAALLAESLALARELGDEQSIGWTLHYLGIVRCAEGRLAEALALHEESLGLFTRIGHAWGTAAATNRLGAVVCERGDVAGATERFVESLELMKELGDRWGIADALQGLASVRAQAGTADHRTWAARAFGAAEALRESFHGTPLPTDRAKADGQKAALAAKLGQRTFVSAWQAGRETALRAGGLDQLLSEAIASARTTPPASRPAAALDGGLPVPLTRREREIAALLARGCTNGEIAQELVIGERTAEWHVANVLGKLGLTSRAQAAVWMATHLPGTAEPRR